MQPMMKERGERAPSGRSVETRSRRRRPGPSDRNQAFLLAFADALRDILREERRRFA